ncbi:M23 family metallopeptidase [Streptomyces sp. HNM0574]|nr:M23 family metallopeptidase [Streptomyces sp. HNM0574]
MGPGLGLDAGSGLTGRALAVPAGTTPTRASPVDHEPPALVTRTWPVHEPHSTRPPRIIRPWDPPPTPWAAGHRGVDLEADPGQAVRAAAPGRITFAGTVAGTGSVTVEHPSSGKPPLRTTYTPVRPKARKGTTVRSGQTVATLADDPTHCGTPCLHWGLLRGKRYLNPLSLLPPQLRHTGPSRLLPVTGVPTPEPRAALAGPHASTGPRTPVAARTGSAGGDARLAPAVIAAALLVGVIWARRRLARPRGRRTRTTAGPRGPPGALLRTAVPRRPPPGAAWAALRMAAAGP